MVSAGKVHREEGGRHGQVRAQRAGPGDERRAAGSVDLLLDEFALLPLRRAPPCGCLADSDP